MSFASLTFLYFFLPFTLLGYYLLPRAWRNGFLLAANLLFYAWGEPSFLVVILATTVINFYAAKRMQANPAHKKRWAISAAVFDLGLLGIFKYAGFLLDILRPAFFWTDLPAVKIPLPLGISFYTFQVLSYIIDVYRQDTIPQRSFTRFATYMTLFPQLIAGPIIRYRDLANQLGTRQQTLARFSGGIRLLLVGLGKKVLLANQMGALWEALKANPTENGWARSRLPCKFILISAVIRIWRVGLANYLPLNCRLTLIIPIFRGVFRNFGGAGTFHLAHGSGIMCTSRLAAAVKVPAKPSVIYLWFGR